MRPGGAHGVPKMLDTATGKPSAMWTWFAHLLFLHAGQFSHLTAIDRPSSSDSNTSAHGHPQMRCVIFWFLSMTTVFTPPSPLHLRRTTCNIKGLIQPPLCLRSKLVVHADREAPRQPHSVDDCSGVFRLSVCGAFAKGGDLKEVCLAARGRILEVLPSMELRSHAVEQPSSGLTKKYCISEEHGQCQ